MPALRPLVSLAMVACLALPLAGCDPPAEADLPISPRGAAAGAPELAPTERFERTLARAGPDMRLRAAGAEALAARAQALRARAQALDAPVIATETRGRLRDALKAAE